MLGIKPSLARFGAKHESCAGHRSMKLAQLLTAFIGASVNAQMRWHVRKCAVQSLTHRGSGNVGRAPQVMSVLVLQSVVLPEGVTLVMMKRGLPGILGYELSQHLHYTLYVSRMTDPALKMVMGLGTSQHQHLWVVHTCKMAAGIYLSHMLHRAIVKMHCNHSCRLQTSQGPANPKDCGVFYFLPCQLRKFNLKGQRKQRDREASALSFKDEGPVWRQAKGVWPGNGSFNYLNHCGPENGSTWSCWNQSLTSAKTRKGKPKTTSHIWFLSKAALQTFLHPTMVASGFPGTLWITSMQPKHRQQSAHSNGQPRKSGKSHLK